MTAKEYLKLHKIEIDDEVEKQIKEPYDLDCVMDASWLFDTNKIDLNTFKEAQTYVHNYFNGNIDEEDEDYQDLSLSLTAQYFHYSQYEVDSGRQETNSILVPVKFENEIAYYEIP